MVENAVAGAQHGRIDEQLELVDQPGRDQRRVLLLAKLRPNDLLLEAFD
ncbi:hypothetical protein [Mesorhizobium sp. B2-7-3]|nr:hypothetical protein [Mesorhizobium sp. B2-7-3]